MPSAGVANGGETCCGGLTRANDGGLGLRRVRGARRDRDLVAAGTQRRLCNAAVVGSQVEGLVLTRHRDVRAGPGRAGDRAVGGKPAAEANVHHQRPACWACRPAGGGGHHHHQRNQDGRLPVARRHVHRQLASLLGKSGLCGEHTESGVQVSCQRTVAGEIAGRPDGGLHQKAPCSSDQRSQVVPRLATHRVPGAAGVAPGVRPIALRRSPSSASLRSGVRA